MAVGINIILMVNLLAGDLLLGMRMQTLMDGRPSSPFHSLCITYVLNCMTMTGNTGLVRGKGGWQLNLYFRWELIEYIYPNGTVLLYYNRKMRVGPR